jgi:chorismate synthase
MTNLQILSSGESHGQRLTGIIEGLPAGLDLDKEKIDYQLHRRQLGYGRGGRMQIENDNIEIVSGVRFGKTMGSPVGISIINKDWDNWKVRMSIWEGKDDTPVEIPRPGHADLAGHFKYGHNDLRNILERASARETAMRVAIGSIIRQLLDQFNVWIGSHVIQIHDIKNENTFQSLSENNNSDVLLSIKSLSQKAERSELRCSDPDVESGMKKQIKAAKKNGDSVGGVFELSALHVPIGLGSYSSWDRRLDTRLAGHIMSIPGIKAVEIGLGKESAARLGSQMHDPILPGEKGIILRSSNRAGGIEGGISNGEPVLIQAAMKPIPTLTKPLPSVHLSTGKTVSSHRERSDVCAVPSASIVGEAMLAMVLGNAFCEKYGGDSMEQMKKHFYDGKKA